MKTHSDLDHLPLEPAIKAQVTELVQSLTAALAAKEAKISALTYELAQYKRLRFGTKNEALAGLQRDLF
jgi:transposase